MKLNEIKLGDKVKVADTPDAQVYVIQMITKTSVFLRYKNAKGRYVNGGWSDISLLIKA